MSISKIILICVFMIPEKVKWPKDQKQSNYLSPMKTSIRKRLTLGVSLTMMPSIQTTCRIESSRMDEQARAKCIDCINNFDQSKEIVTNPRIENNAFFFDHPNTNNRIWITRKIIKVQTNSIKFENGSWLYFPKASESHDTKDNTKREILYTIKDSQFFTL